MRLKSLSARVTVPEFILNGRYPGYTDPVSSRSAELLHYCERQGAEFRPRNGAGTGA
jgi:hypothetical protein